MKLTYPTSLRGIGEWAASNRMTVAEAKFRFAQCGILQAVADSHTLSQVLAFKGGNALDFVWLPNRSTKLRALLQQPLRNRHRPQDVLDICVAVQENPHLDLSLTGEFLLEKAKARNVPVSRAAFHQAEIKTRAFEGYNQLRETTRHAFIEFEEAFEIVLSLVHRLPLPDET